MPELPVLGHVLKLRVIGDQVTAEAEAERLAQDRRRIDQQAVALGRRMKEHLALDAALGVGDTGVQGAAGIGLAHILGDLAIQVRLPRDAIWRVRKGPRRPPGTGWSDIGRLPCLVQA